MAILNLSDPTDESHTDHGTAYGVEMDPLGGLLGDGDLTTNDGDTSGFSMWAVNTSDSGSPGVDIFSYAVDPVPDGAILETAVLHVVARHVAHNGYVITRPDGLYHPWDEWEGLGYPNMYFAWRAWSDPAIDDYGDGTLQFTGFSTDQIDTGSPDRFTYAETTAPINMAAIESNGGRITFETLGNGNNPDSRANWYVTQAWITIDVGEEPPTVDPSITGEFGDVRRRFIG